MFASSLSSLLCRVMHKTIIILAFLETPLIHYSLAGGGGRRGVRQVSIILLQPSPSSQILLLISSPKHGHFLPLGSAYQTIINLSGLCIFIR